MFYKNIKNKLLQLTERYCGQKNYKDQQHTANAATHAQHQSTSAQHIQN